MKKLLVVITLFICVAYGATYTRSPAAANLEVWMLDVGQGESVLLRDSTGFTILFDGGPTNRVLSQLGGILPPNLRSLDLVILSHPHSDHIRGLIPVLERYTVGEVWSSGATHKSADFQAWQIQLEKHNHRSVHAGYTAHMGNTDLLVMHPLSDVSGKQLEVTHDGTVSVMVSVPNLRLFLTGDLDEPQEKNLVNQCKPPTCSLRADVFQVPHHGSANSSLPAFLDAVSPSIALIPVGINNTFNHPRQITLDRLAERSIKTYRTDTQGQLKLTITSTQVVISGDRLAKENWTLIETVPP